MKNRTIAVASILLLTFSAPLFSQRVGVAVIVLPDRIYQLFEMEQWNSG